MSRWIRHNGRLWIRPGTYVQENNYRQEVLAEFTDEETESERRRRMDTVINSERLRAMREHMLVKCEDCPWSLTCMAGRLFEQHEHNHLCVECGRLVIVINENSYPVQHHTYGAGHTWKDQRVIVDTEKFFCEKRKADDRLREEYFKLEGKMGSFVVCPDPAEHNQYLRMSQCMECMDNIRQINRGYRLTSSRKERGALGRPKR